MTKLQKETEPQNPPEITELPHDDEPQLYPVYAGGEFIGFERIHEDDLNSENSGDHE